MYYNDHGPPHFHARYGDRVIRVAIENGHILSGTFPRRAQGFVLEWLALHRDELLEEPLAKLPGDWGGRSPQLSW